MNEEYLAYLRSNEWRERRLEFLEDSNYECEECGEDAKEVHHKHYNSIGNEERDDVEVLCSDCHENREIEKGTDMTEGGEYGEY